MLENVSTCVASSSQYDSALVKTPAVPPENLSQSASQEESHCKAGKSKGRAWEQQKHIN